MLIDIIILLVLLFLSGFFSGSETAFMSANRVKIRELAHNNDMRAVKVDKLLEDETRLLTTILIGNNLVNIAASAIATAVAIDIFGKKGIGIATGIVTLFILIFGEITPKSLGNHKSIKFSKIAAPYLFWMGKILSPVIYLFSLLIKVMIGEDNLISSAFLSEEEIKRFVNVSQEEGVIKKDESEMIKSVFDFDDTMVKEIMIPRIDMACIEKKSDITELIDMAIEKGHSRVPVFEETIDDIVGLVYVKDLLQLIQNNEEAHALEEFIKPIYFIPETKPINQLLNEMQRRKEHMAVVLDEYGGTSGLITIEDLLEEIVGDIQDEFDLEPKQIDVINENEILTDGRVDIGDINEILPELLVDQEEYETISGFVLHYLGYFPEEGEEIEMNGLKIRVDRISEHRIKKVRIYTDKPVKFK